MRMKGKRLAAIAVSLVLGFTGWIFPALGEDNAQAMNGLQLAEPELVTELNLRASVLQVLPLEDGTFLLGGTINQSEDVPFALAICVDANGVEQWRFTQAPEGKYTNLFRELFALENDTLGLVLESIGEKQFQFLFLRNGEVLKRVEITKNADSQFFQVNGRFLCCSAEASAFYNEMMTYRSLTCYDNEMNQQWSVSYDIPFDIRQIIPVADGYLLFGTLQGLTQAETLTYQGFVGKVDASGVLQWYVETEETNLRYWNALQLEDGSYIAMGVCTDPAKHHSLHLTRYDENLNEVDVKHTMVHAKNLFSEVSNMLPVPGGFLLACGNETESGMLTLLAYNNACDLVDSVSFPTSLEAIKMCSLCASDQGIFVFVYGAQRTTDSLIWNTLMYKLSSIP